MVSFGTAISKPSETHNQLWRQPPKELQLETNEIHVWLVSISSVDVAQFELILSDDERARAARFYNREAKIEYTAAKGFLREIIAKYTKIVPQFLHFKYNEYGKPFLANKTNYRVKFSVSHSRGLALFAVSREIEIGADLEFIDAEKVSPETARRVLTPQEFTHFYQLNTCEKQTFFYQCWTRKEAVSKASGSGLMIEPNQIQTLFPNPANESLIQRTAKWILFEAPPVKDFAVAIAAQAMLKPKVEYWGLTGIL